MAIDFGLSRVRDPDETDQQWRLAKVEAVEHTSVGKVLEATLVARYRETRPMPDGDGDADGAARARQSRKGNKAIETKLWKYTSGNKWWWRLSDEEKKMHEKYGLVGMRYPLRRPEEDTMVLLDGEPWLQAEES